MIEKVNAMQKLRYRVTVEDVVAFNEFHCLRSPTAIQKRQRKRVIVSVVAALVYFVIGCYIQASTSWGTGLWFPILFGLTIGAICYVIASPRFAIPHLLRYIVRKRYAKPDMSKFLGEHTLEVDDQGFTHRTNYSETRYAWGALERIETEQDRTYLYISAIQAIVIPHKNIEEGNFTALLEAMKAHYTPGQVLARPKTP